jgi:hypothetical protein
VFGADGVLANAGAAGDGCRSKHATKHQRSRRQRGKAGYQAKGQQSKQWV